MPLPTEDQKDEIIKAAENLFNHQAMYPEQMAIPSELWAALGFALGKGGPFKPGEKLPVERRQMPTRLELENHFAEMGSQMLPVEDALQRITYTIRDTKISDIKDAPITRQEFEALSLEVGYLTRLLERRRAYP